MYDAAAALGREGGGQPAAQLLEVGHIARLDPRQLLAEASYLALQVALRFAEVAQPYLGRRDRVQVDEDVDELVGGAAALRLIEPSRELRAIGGHKPLNVLHDVERRVVDPGVLTQRDRARHRDVRGGQRRDYSELALHIVRRGLHVGERRAAEHPGLLLRMDAVGEVGASVADNLGPQLINGGDVRPEPGSQPLEVYAGDATAHRATPPLSMPPPRTMVLRDDVTLYSIPATIPHGATVVR